MKSHVLSDSGEKTAPRYVSAKMTHLVDEEKAVDIVYLDFSKAFDTVSQRIVLEKPDAYSLDRCTLCWVKNWLDG
ncbi:hypothetical protein BTVI_101887 [Pitangus sulphuratus]|nr:hypothetical protein BTVI_101887 [Pitangus sulphuratus]